MYRYFRNRNRPELAIFRWDVEAKTGSFIWPGTDKVEECSVLTIDFFANWPSEYEEIQPTW